MSAADSQVGSGNPKLMYSRKQQEPFSLVPPFPDPSEVTVDDLRAKNHQLQSRLVTALCAQLYPEGTNPCDTLYIGNRFQRETAS